MPEFNELGGGALGLNEAIGRALGMEKLAPASTLTPEISVQLELGIPPIEWMMLMGWKRASISLLIANVAAELGYCGILNPAGSGVIAVAQLGASQGSAAGALATYTIRTNITDTPTVNAGIVPDDLRWGSQLTTCHLITGAEPAGTGGAIGRVAWLPESTQYPRRFVLGPGTNLVIEHATVNIAFNGELYFFERRARPEELTP